MEDKRGQNEISKHPVKPRRAPCTSHEEGEGTEEGVGEGEGKVERQTEGGEEAVSGGGGW